MSQSRDGLEQRPARRNYRGQIERLREFGGDAIPNVLHRNVLDAQLATDRRHDDAVNSARDDEIEIGEVGRDVEGEPVPGDPVARVHADRGDLLAAGPHSGERSIPFAGNSIVGERVDQRFLDLSQVPVQILLVALEIDDRISDELAGSVEGDVSSALDLEQLHAFALEKLRGCDEVLFLRRPAERDYRWVLDEEEEVLRNRSRDSIASEVALQLERFFVAQFAEWDSP